MGIYLTFRVDYILRTGCLPESTIYEMPSDKSFISKRIYNDSQKQNLYSIGAVKIDKLDREVKTEVPLLKANFCLRR